MQTDTETLYQAARGLPKSELVVLIARLLESLPASSEGLSLDAPDLEAEFDRRFADQEGGISWTQLRDEKQGPRRRSFFDKRPSASSD